MKELRRLRGVAAARPLFEAAAPLSAANCSKNKVLKPYGAAKARLSAPGVLIYPAPIFFMQEG